MLRYFYVLLTNGTLLVMTMQVIFQVSSSSSSNPVNSLSFEQGNAFLITSSAQAGKGLLLFPKNP